MRSLWVRPMWVIARCTFVECLRDKLLYTGLIFGVVLLLFSLLLGEWALQYQALVMRSFGFTVMEFTGAFLAVFIGVGVLQRELRNQTLQVVLAREVPRWIFVLGKFLGIQCMWLINLVVMSIILVLLLTGSGHGLGGGFLYCVLSIYLEISILMSAALLLATFSSYYLGGWLTFGVFVIGHLVQGFSDQVRQLSRQGSVLPDAFRMPEWFASLFYWISQLVPNFKHFAYREAYLQGIPVPGAAVSFSILYTVCFAALFLLLACLWFSRRDLDRV